jgi:hypothetical protein
MRTSHATTPGSIGTSSTCASLQLDSFVPPLQYMDLPSLRVTDVWYLSLDVLIMTVESFKRRCQALGL